MQVPYFKQEWENSCGVASIRMIVGYFGKRVSERYLRELIKLKEDDLGTTPIQLENICKKLGYKTVLEDNSSIDEIKRFLNDNIPVIVLIDPGAIEGKPWVYAAHFIIITKIDGKCIYFNDPAKGKSKLDLDTFDRCWEYCDRVLLVLQREK